MADLLTTGFNQPDFSKETYMGSVPLRRKSIREIRRAAERLKAKPKSQNTHRGFAS